jgi:heme/copper-type cytochrome/quinol oxidase subunit 2
MGAVFSIFAGFYYWFEKMIGLRYNEALGKLHFWIFFAGVNITFFPMHFLGTAGMPRRVPDYPDAFAGWNWICTQGSAISVIATYIFFVNIAWSLHVKIPGRKNPWKRTDLLERISRVPGFFIDDSKLSLDVPLPWQMNFQDPATPIMEGIVDFHHDIMFLVIFITIFVSYLMYRIIYLWDGEKRDNIEMPPIVTHCTSLETIWTIIPALLLVWIAIPSFTLLYAMDHLPEPGLSFKAIGHQWYWSYEFTQAPWLNEEYKVRTFQFDSYMLSDATTWKTFKKILLMRKKYNDTWYHVGKPTGWYRLLEVDNRLVLPILTSIRVLISSTDVLHSWAVPSLGVKLDACPGRLNQVPVFIKREGLFYGQCSEICGVNHGFMPIAVQATNTKYFNEWFLSHLL